MARNTRKKVFPKKPELLTSKNVHKLGKGSNNHRYANEMAIYCQPIKRQEKTELTELQKKMLERLKR